jgi:hypothetical protein
VPRPLLLVLVACVPLSGCMYRIGSNLGAGVLDEASGRGRSGGVELVGERLVEEAILLELGRQLGEGLAGGAADVTPEQRATLEAAIEGVMAVAAARMAAGLRDDVSPELREMVKSDIVAPLATGMRGEFGEALAFSVDRAVEQAEQSVEEAVQDPDLREAIADLIRSAIHEAMTEGRPGAPGVGQTLENTLTYNLLLPFEETVDELTKTVADRVDESARRTEGTLQAIISALALILGLFVLMYALTRRQLVRARQKEEAAEQDLRTMGAALSLLDEETRAKVAGKVDEYHQVVGVRAPDDLDAAVRSDHYERPSDYERKDKP